MYKSAGTPYNIIKLFFAFVLLFYFTVSAFAADERYSYFNVLTPVVSTLVGSASNSIPITVPPGRANLSPKLTLKYNSYGKNGWVGVGWSLDMGSIQRSTKRGVNYSADDYVVSLDGTISELVARPDWGSGYYGSKIEGAFSKFYKDSSGGWIMTTKDGMKYYYGTSAASRQNNSHGTFKWCLDRVEDTNGNYMTISYSKLSDGEIYLDQIDYTGHANLPPTNQVKFFLVNRYDFFVSYKTKSPVSISRLLKRIEVYGNGLLARKYVFSYNYSNTTGRSRLDTVVQYGSDGETTLPTIVFQYQDPGKTISVSDWKANLFSAGRTYHWIGDFNGDGRMDIASYVREGRSLRMNYSTGSGFNRTTVSGLHLATVHYPANWNWVGDFNGDGKMDIASWGGIESAVWIHYSTGNGFNPKCYSGGGIWLHDNLLNWIGDFDGDGKSDIASYVPDSNGARIRIHYSTGNGFDVRVFNVNICPDSPTIFNWIGDFNGDGRMDIASWVSRTHIRVHYSLGRSGFTQSNYYNVNIGDSIGVWTADFNGDGKTDIASYTQGGSGLWVHYSTGNGFDVRHHNIQIYPADPPNPWNWVGDFNGDGMADIASWHTYNDRSKLRIHYSKGTRGFTTVSYGGLSLFPESPPSKWNWLGDFTGDGKTDIVSNWNPENPNKPLQMHSLPDVFPDLLMSINNGVGGLTQITYRSSAEYSNTCLPFIVPTVASISVKDGNGTVSTTRYTYSGGFFDFAEREFRGFSYSKQTNPDGSTIENWFHQDDYRKGKVYRTRLRGSGIGLFSEVTQAWSTYPSAPNTWAFVKLDLKRTEFYDEETVFSQEEYTYDTDNGNLLSTVSSGTGAESVTTTNQYQNYGDWVWRLTQRTVTGSMSGIVRETYYGYETGTGNKLWEEQWLEGGTNPRVQYAYDAYGNPISVTDPRGNTTTITYDTVAHAFPAVTTHPQTGGVTHVEEILEYDYRFGKVREKRDENNKHTYYSYDVFGRVTQVEHPDGGQVTTEYYDDGFPRHVVTRVKENASGDTISNYEYFDGMGRSIQSITFGEDQKSIVKRLYYDNMGRNYRVEGPYFAMGVGYPKEPLDPNVPYVETTYDGRGRPKTVTRPDGEHGTVTITSTWIGLSTTVRDPDGRQKTEKKDYLGRVIEVREHTETGPQVTTYQYNAAGDLLEVTAHGNTTTMTYDTLGRKIAMQDPDMGAWSYTYDAKGNLLSQTDAKGQTITYAYDALDRVLSKSYSTGDPQVTYTYDNLTILNGRGRLYSVSNGDVTTTYEAYDEMGRTLMVTKSIVGAPDPYYFTSYTYDLAGKVLTMTYPDDFVVTYEYYEGTGLLKRVTGSDSRQYAFYSQYEPSGKIGQIDHENGTATKYNYDALSGKLVGIVTADPTGEPENDIVRKVYSYTPGGNIDGITDDLYGGLNPQMADYTMTYTYDTSKTHAVKAINLNGEDYIFHYDANGNMVKGYDFSDINDVGTREFTYNAENKPVEITLTKGGSTVRAYYVYDGEGRRARKRVVGSESSETFYVGEHFEIRGGVVTRYIFGAGMRLALVSTKGTYAFHKDHLGSTLAVSDSAGAKVEETRYLPFGAQADHIGTTVTEYKFTDQELDPEVGLYNYGARLYDPVIGRFVSADTTVPDQFDPQMLDRYGYCRNNPLKYNDPTGHGLGGDPDEFGGHSGPGDSPCAGLGGNTTSRGFGGGKTEQTLIPSDYFRNPIDEKGAVQINILNYYGYYDLRTGSYLNPDPIDLPEEMNLFAYTLNNPVNEVGPLGLDDLLGQPRQASSNPFPSLPSFSEAFPASHFLAPAADIIVGGVEAGVSVTTGITAAITFAAGPEFWCLTVLTAPIAIESGWDAYSRIKTGIERLDEDKSCP